MTSTATPQTPDYITITLTDRPPVRIREDQWPLIAEAAYHDYDGQYDFQSYDHWRGWIRVRQHADGRTLVSASCSYDTAHQGRRDYAERAGLLLDGTPDLPQIIEAVHQVHQSITVVDEAHADLWHALAKECLAELPAEDL